MADIEALSIADIASECLGLTRADYLEHIVRHNVLPSITREDSEFLAPTQPKKNLNQVLHGRVSFITHLIPPAQNSLLGCHRLQNLKFYVTVFCLN